LEYKLEITAAFAFPQPIDTCMLCGDSIIDTRVTVSSDRTIANQLLLIFDEGCFHQIVAIGLKCLYEMYSPTIESPN
jgi:hypothetical protein